MRPRIAVIGVGGAGGNAVNNMIAAGLAGAEFMVANTDAQALEASGAEKRIQLGSSLTEGLGAGSKPEIGEAAAEEAIEDIRDAVAGCHMVFIAAGMGGGTGTGAASVIARVAKEFGILTVAVVTKPFQFEGSRRMRVAEAGIAELRQARRHAARHPQSESVPHRHRPHDVCRGLRAGRPGALFRHRLHRRPDRQGRADQPRPCRRQDGAGRHGHRHDGHGRGRPASSAPSLPPRRPIVNPLLDDTSLKGAKSLLLSITGGRDLTLWEVDEAANRVRQEVDPDANIIVGATFDEALGDKVRVSIVASGMGALARPAACRQ